MTPRPSPPRAALPAPTRSCSAPAKKSGLAMLPSTVYCEVRQHILRSEEGEVSGGLAHNVWQVHDRSRVARVENGSQSTSGRERSDEVCVACYESVPPCQLGEEQLTLPAGVSVQLEKR